MAEQTTVYLALGSNIGDSGVYLNQAVEMLGHKLTSIKQAPIYSSKAVGYTDQPDFLNSALQAQTDMEPLELLKFVKDVERQIGRVSRFRWGPREIDIDIIFYGDTVLDTPVLVVPHPRFAERDFVLRPIVDLDPKVVDPLSGKTVKAILSELPPSQLAIL